MAKLMKMLQPLQSEYVDRRFDGTKEEYFQQLELSSTLYIGNLSFYTTEDQVYELFGKVGSVRRVIMGLDRHTKTPCGFCFVIYHTRGDALRAVQYLNGTKLDNRQLRVDIDYGFEEGRQYGRGRSGGQVRDEFRTDYDAERGGYGRVVAQQLASQQLAMWQEVQAGALLGAGVLPDGAGGGAVFFGQDQREQLGQQQQAKPGDGGSEAAGGEGAEGAEGAAAAEGEEQEGEGAEAAEEFSSVVNPRMAGRGRDADDEGSDGDEADDERASKRRRMGEGPQGGGEAAAGAAAAAAAAGEDEEMAAGDEGGDDAADAQEQPGSEEQLDDAGDEDD